MPGLHAANGVSSPSSTVAGIHAIHAAFDIWPAKPDQMAEAREFAAALIGGAIATPRTLARVHARTGAALFLAREEGRLTGVWAAVLLTEAGVRACHNDRFNALDPAADHIAECSSEPVGVYAWGIAGATKESARRLLISAAAVDQATLSQLPGFTRPTTPDGMRLALERMNFTPVPGSKTGLVWMEPRIAQPRAA